MGLNGDFAKFIREPKDLPEALHYCPKLEDINKQQEGTSGNTVINNNQQMTKFHNGGSFNRQSNNWKHNNQRPNFQPNKMNFQNRSNQYNNFNRPKFNRISESSHQNNFQSK